MKKLLILSGKGGTGKTTTAAAFIRIANAKAFADCDVDAPNLHILTETSDEVFSTDYYGSEKAVISSEKCIGCEACVKHCKFEAIENRDGKCKVNEFACEGCGVCTVVCPQNAISMVEDVAVRLTLDVNDKVFSTAELKMGRGNSGKLVSEVKNVMIKAAPESDIAIIDGSPGIGCPVIASVNGVDLALIVTEPSISGLSDLTRLLNTASMLQVKVAVCINKYNICIEKAEEIECFCNDNNISFVGVIPYDKTDSDAINTGKSIADIECHMRESLKEVFYNTMEILEDTNDKIHLK